jgi:hypothetical protein
MCGYMDQSYLPFLYVVSQKMVSHFYVLGFGMEHWVLCNTYGTGVVTLKWNMVYSSPKSLIVYVIQRSCVNVLFLGSGLSNTQLFARRPRHQRRSQELASHISGLPIQPTPGKIHVWKTMKRQRRRRRVPNAEVGSVTQIPEYALNRLLMQSP